MKKRYFLYGVILGLLLIFLQAAKYQIIIHEIEIELFTLFIALIFTALGIWVGTNFYKREVNKSLSNKGEASSILSKREIDVIALLADGDSNQEIADKLFVSLNTAKTHISSIYQKLQVKRRTQAVQKAREMGIISVDIHSKIENHPKV
ncbi:MAG: response regulator transcription factor [Cyclobacteriaceae bacterium]